MDVDVLSWEKIITLPAALLVVGAFLYFVFKSLPTWKEVRLAEIKVREVEATARTTEAGMFGKLSDSLNSLSVTQASLTAVIKDVVIDQRRDTKNIELMQRVNSDAADKILNKLDALENAAEGIADNRKRLDLIEARLDCDETQTEKEESKS